MLLIDLCPHALALQVVGTLLTQCAEPSVTYEPQCKSDFAGRCAWVRALVCSSYPQCPGEATHPHPRPHIFRALLCLYPGAEVS